MATEPGRHMAPERLLMFTADEIKCDAHRWSYTFDAHARKTVPSSRAIANRRAWRFSAAAEPYEKLHDGDFEDVENTASYVRDPGCRQMIRRPIWLARSISLPRAAAGKTPRPGRSARSIVPAQTGRFEARRRSSGIPRVARLRFRGAAVASGARTGLEPLCRICSRSQQGFAAKRHRASRRWPGRTSACHGARRLHASPSFLRRAGLARASRVAAMHEVLSCSSLRPFLANGSAALVSGGLSSANEPGRPSRDLGVAAANAIWK